MNMYSWFNNLQFLEVVIDLYYTLLAGLSDMAKKKSSMGKSNCLYVSPYQRDVIICSTLIRLAYMKIPGRHDIISSELFPFIIHIILFV